MQHHRWTRYSIAFHHWPRPSGRGGGGEERASRNALNGLAWRPLRRRFRKFCADGRAFRRRHHIGLSSPPSPRKPAPTDSRPPSHFFPPAMSAPDPQEAWRRLQTELTRRTARFGGAGGGRPPKGTFGGIAGLVIIGGGIFIANNALFNGSCILHWAIEGPGFHPSRFAKLTAPQWMVATAPSSTPE